MSTTLPTGHATMMNETTNIKNNPTISVLSLPSGASKWNLVVDFLALRKEVFIQRKQWSLTYSQGIEWEQYDSVGHAVYVVAHYGDRVVGGARLLRCDTIIGSKIHPYSYMIRDAFLGRIDLPSEICIEPPPEDASAWELTRIISVGAPGETRMAIVDAAFRYILEQNGKYCLFLGSPGFIRMARGLGYEFERLGPICGDESGRFLAMKFDLSDYEVVDKTTKW